MSAIPSDAEIKAMAYEKMRLFGSPRCLFVSGVLDLPPMEPPPSPTGATYTKTILPYDSEPGATQAAKSMSACGLVTEVGWRYARVDAPLIYGPYIPRSQKGGIQYAVSYEKHIAEKAGCWVDCVTWREGMPLPLEGDAPIIGCEGCGGGWARNVANVSHEFTVVAWDDEARCHSVDGGQPGIHFRTRAFVQVWTSTAPDGRAQGELWCASVDKKSGKPIMAADGRPAIGRRCIGYTSVPGLPLLGGAQACLVSPDRTVAQALSDAVSEVTLQDVLLYGGGAALLVATGLELTGKLDPLLARARRAF